MLERLLSITGEDTLTIDRKYKSAWTGRLGVRLMMLTNELPRVADASGALPSRFLLLRCPRSFYGAEDPTLSEKLERELDGIVLWALDGLDRLRARGHFQQPASGRSELDDFEALGSPVAAFVSEACELGSEHIVQPKDLFAGWQRWSSKRGYQPGNVQTFGRDLRAAIPEVSVVQPRDHGTGRPVRHYAGIRLRTESDARFDTETREARVYPLFREQQPRQDSV